MDFIGKKAPATHLIRTNFAYVKRQSIQTEFILINLNMLMKMVGGFHEQISRATYTKIPALNTCFVNYIHTHPIIQSWLIIVLVSKLTSLLSSWGAAPVNEHLAFLGWDGVEPGAEILIFPKIFSFPSNHQAIRCLFGIGRNLLYFSSLENPLEKSPLDQKQAQLQHLFDKSKEFNLHKIRSNYSKKW